MKSICIAFCLTALAATSANAETCYMEVDRQIVMQGSCTFEADADGSFRIMGNDYDDAAGTGHFALVSLTEKGTAVGSWTGEGGAVRAHAPLGQLFRNGGCWINHTTRVCAWE